MYAFDTHYWFILSSIKHPNSKTFSIANRSDCVNVTHARLLPVSDSDYCFFPVCRAVMHKPYFLLPQAISVAPTNTPRKYVMATADGTALLAKSQHERCQMRISWKTWESKCTVFTREFTFSHTGARLFRMDVFFVVIFAFTRLHASVRRLIKCIFSMPHSEVSDQTKWREKKNRPIHLCASFKYRSRWLGWQITEQSLRCIWIPADSLDTLHWVLARDS